MLGPRRTPVILFFGVLFPLASILMYSLIISVFVLAVAARGLGLSVDLAASLCVVALVLLVLLVLLLLLFLLFCLVLLLIVLASMLSRTPLPTSTWLLYIARTFVLTQETGQIGTTWLYTEN